MKGILITFAIVLCYFHTIQGYSNLEKYRRFFQKRKRVANCEQETPNCNQCLAKLGCSWCGNDGIFECSTKQSCSRQDRENACTTLNPKSDIIDTFDRENVVSFLDIPVVNSPGDVDFGANSCSPRNNCSYCTSSQECTWCETTRKCLHSYNTTTTTEACGSDLWYKEQCLYSSKVKPCPERSSGCKECTADSVCFWCKTTGNCSYYLHDAFIPDNCPRDSWYYESCSRMELIVVLAPILCILGIPVLIFIVLGIVLYCMKRMGYQGLEDPEESEEKSESPRNEKKPFMMSHKPEPSRIEELKKKYNLEDRP